jgi:hypothetical protein
MERDKNGYVMVMILILIAFGLSLSGGLLSLAQQIPAGATRYTLKNTPAASSDPTLQLRTLDFVSIPPVCNPGLNYGDEPGILYAFYPACDEQVAAGGKIKVWYTDEHALTMGSNPGVSPMPADGSMTLANPGVGDIAAKDQYGLPFFPGLYLTDITLDPNSTAGDAQNGGKGIPPSMVYGTWKALGDPDPPGNDSLPPGADQFSSILPKYINTNAGQRGHEPGFQAELIWNIDSLGLIGGHAYRAHFVIHDGDKTGDIGLGCITVMMNE